MRFNVDLLTRGVLRESACVECKLSQGGLPASVWESYSAFANSDGGVILLGVMERSDGSLNVKGVENADKIVKDFWNGVNNTQKVSVNILTNQMVRVEAVDGKSIIVIEVPRAERSMRPVYVGQNPASGTYRRNGDGDFHCTKEQITAMYRDASLEPMDMRVVERFDSSVFDADSLRHYRNRLLSVHPKHAWNNIDDELFLRRIGAMGLSSDDMGFHPTVAGLLMFGTEPDITTEFPMYFLDYQESSTGFMRWNDRFVSSSGEWSGNIFEFYFKAYRKLTEDFKVPFRTDGLTRIDETPAHVAVREALLNAVVNADYYGRQGIVVRKGEESITIANPGDMRIGLETALEGGVSDPRNGTIMKMFSLIGIGERAGTGIPGFMNAWESEFGSIPQYNITQNPDRTTLTMMLRPSDIVAEQVPKYDMANRKKGKSELIMDFLRHNPDSRTVHIAEYTGLTTSGVKKHLYELLKKGVIEASGANKNRTYSVKL